MTKELIARIHKQWALRDPLDPLRNTVLEAADAIEALQARVVELESEIAQITETTSAKLLRKCDTLQARVAELERQNKDLDRSETQLIQERDEREEVINALCDTVLGTDRYEWSSMYSFDDAVEEVAVKTAVLDKEVSELYALRKENAKLAAELTAIKNQEPVEIDWPDYHHEAMGCGLEDRNIHDRYEAMQYGWDQAIERVAERLPEEIFAAPILPVREP